MRPDPSKVAGFALAVATGLAHVTFAIKEPVDRRQVDSTWAGTRFFVSTYDMFAVENVTSSDLQASFLTSAQEVGDAIGNCVANFSTVENALWRGMRLAYEQNNTNGWEEWGYFRKGGPSSNFDSSQFTTWVEGDDPSNYRFLELALEDGSTKTIEIYEPCNMASNLAYYRVSAQVCRAENLGNEKLRQGLASGLALQGFGSAYYHGSESDLGHTFDAGPTDLIAFAAVQQLYASVVESSDDASLDPLVYLDQSGKPDALEMTNTLYAELGDDNITGSEWQSYWIESKRPDFFFSFGCYIVGISTPIMGEGFTKRISLPIGKLLAGPSDKQTFLESTYFPAAVKASERISISFRSKVKLFRAFVASIFELIFAFVFNEGPVHRSLEGRELITALAPFGARRMKGIMESARKLGGDLFRDLDTDQDLINTTPNLYPGMGSDKCNGYAHPIWHVVSASALYHLAIVAHEAGQQFSPLRLRRLYSDPEPESESPTASVAEANSMSDEEAIEKIMQLIRDYVATFSLSKLERDAIDSALALFTPFLAEDLTAAEVEKFFVESTTLEEKIDIILILSVAAGILALCLVITWFCVKWEVRCCMKIFCKHKKQISVDEEEDQIVTRLD